MDEQNLMEQERLDENPDQKKQPSSGGKNTNRWILYILAGGYLVYLAIKILSGILPKAASGWSGTQIALTCSAAVFAIFGCGLVVSTIIRWIRSLSNEKQEDEDNG